MTFIASIKAKDGIAVIADSLVSTVQGTIMQRNWDKFIGEKKKGVKEGEDFKLTEEEVSSLFESKPSYTKDYQNKIFELDEQTLITTAGAAYINNKEIGKIVSEISAKLKRKKLIKELDKKVDAFILMLVEEIKAHLKSQKRIHTTILIFSHFNKKAGESKIIKLSVLPNKFKALSDSNTQYCNKEEPSTHVVCDGQNGLADRILYGGIGDIYNAQRVTTAALKTALKDLGIEEEKPLPKGFFEDINKKVFSEIMENHRKEVYLFHLSSLSLQQAVDLAYLLLKVERDFQAYTKDIPTVGGLVKLATINEEGIHFVLGKTIIKPTRHL